MYRQLIYLSYAVGALPPKALQDIATTAHHANVANGITGLLVHIDGAFLQVIEGPSAAIATLMANISKDSRHRGLHVVTDTTVRERAFSAWSMGTFDVDPATVPASAVFKVTPENVRTIAREVDSSKVRAFLETFYEVQIGPGALAASA